MKKGTGFGYGDFLSPFTWRYGSSEMRAIFSEVERRAAWRGAWVELARAEARRGLVSEEELEDIISHSSRERVDIARAHEIEGEIRHDLMAEVRAFAEQAKKGGGKIHLGATSMDIEDNADMLLFRRAAELTLTRLVGCLDAMTRQAVRHRDLVCMAWTHLQPAEPTTLGYRLTNYAQDLVMDVRLIELLLKEFMKGKGTKGAVGTSASYLKLLGSSEEVSRLERSVMSGMGLDSFPVSTQTYPRKVDFLILSCLASIAQSCHKFGLDLRVLQSPPIGELSEPIGEKQVGSSAMPFKKNPVSAERMCSLARYVSVLPGVAFMNGANSILERTLDDSASRRLTMPEAFLAVDECLMLYERLARGLVVYPKMMKRNLDRFGQFAGTEALLMHLSAGGEDRQKMHEVIRRHSFKAWEEVMNGGENPLMEMLSADPVIGRRLSRGDLARLLRPEEHVGRASEMTEEFASRVAKPMLRRYAGRRASGGRGAF